MGRRKGEEGCFFRRQAVKKNGTKTIFLIVSPTENVFNMAAANVCRSISMSLFLY